MQIENLITEHIDTWTSAIKQKSATGRGSSKKVELYGIKKLRELILELAVRGKLVPQDPNDEPASVLLERIAEEKTLLVKEKKIKKQKELPEITDEEKPFELPRGWAWSRLGVVCKKVTDGSHNPPRDAGEGFPMLSSQNVNFDTIDFTTPSRFVTEEDFYKEDKRTSIKTNDILLNIVASIGRSAVVPIGHPKFVLQRSVAVLTSNLVPHYFSKQLVSPLCLNYYDKHAKGTAQKGIYLGKLSLMPLAIAPLAEQHRIVAKVDELMLLCDQLEQQTESSIDAHKTLVEVLLNTLTDAKDATELQTNWARVSEFFDTLFTTEHSIDQLKQTILQLAVMGKLVPQASREARNSPSYEPASKLLERIAEEKAQLIADKKIKKQKALPPITDEEKPFELPNGWECQRIGTFGIVGTGSTPSRSEPSFWHPAEINWVSSGETSELFIGKTKELVSELAIEKTNVSIYPKGTLIVAMYGQGKTRGQITELLEPAGTNQACAAIRLIETGLGHKDFIKLYFRKAYLELRSHAAGGAQPNLNVAKISNTIIPLPPLEEQGRIVIKVNELMEICDQLKSQLNQAQQTQLNLTDALVAQAV